MTEEIGFVTKMGKKFVKMKKSSSWESSWGVSNPKRGLEFRTSCSSSPAAYTDQDATNDSQTHDSDDNSDSNLGASAEGRRATVDVVAWMAARLNRRICARLQRGIERISGIVHDVHGGEGEERCVVVEGDLRNGFSES